MLGRPVQELLGKSMDELFPSELPKSMVEDDLRILRERKPIEVVKELNGRFYRTTKFPITREGEPSLLAGFTMDFTERKRLEEALRKSEEYFRRLTKQSPFLVAIVGDSGAVDFLNERFSATFRYIPDDLPNPGVWWQLAYPDEQYRQEVITTWQEAVEKVGSDPEDIEAHEYRVTCKDGTIRIVAISGSRIRDKTLVFQLFRR
jgi:two-component system sensor histidine kinase/response regulator